MRTRDGLDARGLRRRARRARAGMSLIEVLLGASIAAILMMATAAAFTGNVKAVGSARALTRGTIFLETVLEDVRAQPWANLAVLDGNRVFDGTTPQASQYRVDLTVFQSAVNLMQVRAVLVDLATAREIGRVVGQRSNA